MKTNKAASLKLMALILAMSFLVQLAAAQTSQLDRLKAGIAYFEGGQIAEAKAIFDKLIAEKFVNNDLYYYLGSVLIKQNNPEAALTYFNKIVQSDPNSPYGYIGLGQYYIKKWQLIPAPKPSSIWLYKKTPTALKLTFTAGCCAVIRKNLTMAIADLEKCLQLKGNHAYGHYQLGLAYNQKGRKDLMIVHFNKFVYLAPKAPEAPQVKSLLSRVG